MLGGVLGGEAKIKLMCMGWALGGFRGAISYRFISRTSSRPRPIVSSFFSSSSPCLIVLSSFKFPHFIPFFHFSSSIFSREPLFDFSSPVVLFSPRRFHFSRK